MEVHKDSFSDGQITSKIWLCEELENLQWSSDTTHIYGGWYAMTAFLLFSRGKFKVNYIESFDLDPECERVAYMINQNWNSLKKFHAYTRDCSQPIEGNRDLIINTATEHFPSLDWFNNIPAGTRLVLQGNNMLHDDHFVHSESLDSFINTYPLSEYNFTGTKDFSYPEFSFTRYMIIGTK
jgi:hypothetical protein